MRQLVKGRLTPDLADETRENSSDSEKYEYLPRTAAHTALEEDADLESLITNIFTQTEASVMADY